MLRSSIIRLAVAAFAALAFVAVPSASQAASGNVRLVINKASFIVGVAGGQGTLTFWPPQLSAQHWRAQRRLQRRRVASQPCRYCVQHPPRVGRGRHLFGDHGGCGPHHRR